MASIDISRLNAGQRAVATTLEGPLFVAAGAGSGKTFTLTARLVHALSPGSAADGGAFIDSIDQALVITFTDAAALEIKERVRQALREAGETDPHLREESLRVDGAWISTIHGMCSRILRRHAIELGIDPKFAVCEGSVPEALLAQALDEVMAEVRSDEACAALRAEYPLWSGGMGGAATSVVDMVRALMGEATKCPDGFDGLVWRQSHETATEMARLRQTFESLASLDLTATQRGVLEPSLAALAAYGELAPGERTAERACDTLAQVKPPNSSKKIKPYIDDAKRVLGEATVCAHFERVQALLPQLVSLARRVDERYGELKRAYSYLDNDDLISCALRAVREHPEVARDYAGTFRLVMIDEFQDTDQKQLELISRLAGGEGGNLATVGDAQQSIYRFRGGDVEVFRARGRSLPPEVRVTMDVNYRSDHNVLALVERVCGDGGLLGDFLKLAADAHRRDRFACRDAEGSETEPRIRLEVAAGGTAELMSATLAAQIADRLARYRAQGQAPGSMALLLGTTSRVGLYLDALRARGLPAVVTGGSSFSSTPEVGVIQSLLHTLANPHDTQDGLFRLLTSDLFRLDADDLLQLGTRAQEALDAPTKRPVEQCFVDGTLALFGGAQPSDRLRRAHEVLGRAFERMGRWTVADICQAVVDESGWLQRLEREGLDGMASAANVLAAIRYVRELTSAMGLGVARAATEFDQWLAVAKLTPATLVGDTVDAVQVMTIHGSKGLQFAVTAVAECWGNPDTKGYLASARQDDGSCALCLKPKPNVSGFSTMRSYIEPPDRLDACSSVAEVAALLDQTELAAEAGEKARLLYVALTRAEEALVVGVPVAEAERYQSQLGMGMLGAFPELDGLMPGERAVEITPQRPIECERRVTDADGEMHTERAAVQAAPGVARVITLARQGRGADAAWLADSGHTLEGFDAILPSSVTRIPMLGGSQVTEVADAFDDRFLLYDVRVSELALTGWRPRAGVFSYSSAHAQMAQHATGTSEAASKPEPGPTRTPGKVPKRPPTPPLAQQEAEAEGAPYTTDTDKATNLGSALHELAQTMVETGGPYRPERLEALARTWHLSERQRRRLKEAIERWQGSAIRAEALSYELVRPEVPFFVRVDSAYGRYVEGAIDLLACNRDGREALVVDYKTGDIGLTLEQIEGRHRMQANFYAWVLMDQGFEAVECAFVCVEVDDGTGGPVVVRYRFDDAHRPSVG